MRWRVEQFTGNKSLEDLLNALSSDGWEIFEIGQGRVIARKLRP